MKSHFWLGALAALVSCASLPTGFDEPGLWDTSAQDQETVDAAVAAARGLIGQASEARVEVRGRAFVLDCVGLVQAAWWSAGVDLVAPTARYPGNGVGRLYRALADRGALHWLRTPQVGDLVFWDRTWDTGGDPLYADGHTHVGLVVAVGSDGTVEYVHESATRGIVTARMNLYAPDRVWDHRQRLINSPMYEGSSVGARDNPPAWTSAHLWSAFGDGVVVARVWGRVGRP